jgi:glycosyltransferase involved in cell wall biosynthesis
MRITIVMGFFLPVPAASGGATEKTWYGLARMFAAAGHSVTLVSRRWPGLADSETADGVRHVRVAGFDHTRYLALNLLLDFLWGLRVTRNLPAGDVVICNTIALPVWLSRARPSAGLVAVMVGRAPKGQTRLYGGVARIYAPSSSVARQLAWKPGSGRTLVTGYPIDWQLHAGSAAQSGKPVTIGYIGRLHPEKGIGLLVRAARILAARDDLPAWRLRIAGPSEARQGGGGGAWIDALKRDSADLGTRIEWGPGEFDPIRLARMYGAIDIFCYPSLAEEGETFGVAVAEAMASSCAVVVSGLECFGDLVEDGRTGLVFDHRAPDADRKLADCIARLLRDGGARGEIALRGQQRARRFDFPEVSRQILGDLALLTGAQDKNPR